MTMVVALLVGAEAAADLRVPVRVGIATGRVVVKDGQPFGSSIHLAARLQGIAEPGSVRASRITHQLVQHRFEMHPVPVGSKELEDIQEKDRRGVHAVVSDLKGQRRHAPHGQARPA